MTAAKKSGKVRYVGFTGHKDPSVHLRMLELADQHNFQFDTAQMPLNVMDAHFRSFGKEVVPVLVKKNMGVLGMKSMASAQRKKFRRHARCAQIRTVQRRQECPNGLSCDAPERGAGEEVVELLRGRHGVLFSDVLNSEAGAIPRGRVN
jgi:aryl-alcohol dehydrogenase-like predicted oxidoreductase